MRPLTPLGLARELRALPCKHHARPAPCDACVAKLLRLRFEELSHNFARHARARWFPGEAEVERTAALADVLAAWSSRSRSADQ